MWRQTRSRGEVLVCVCVGFGRENGEEIREKDSFLNLSSVISLSLPPTLQPEIDRAVVGMDTCPVTSMLAQLTHWQRYVLDEAMRHLQSSRTHWAKTAERVMRRKRGGRNEGPDRSFCSTCSWLWSLCEAWPRHQRRLCVWCGTCKAPVMMRVVTPFQNTPHVSPDWLTPTSSHFLRQDYIWRAQVSHKECQMAACLVRWVCACVYACVAICMGQTANETLKE